MNQVLFRVGESVDLLSNRVSDLFLSRIDGKIIRESLRALGHQWRREKVSTELLSVGLKVWARKKTIVRVSVRDRILRYPKRRS